jgi:fructokinase
MMAPKVVALGEVLWDLLPEGRILGGAPANFAFHTHALGADTRLISRVGRDPLGDEILQRLETAHLPIDDVQMDPVAPTGTVSVALSDEGQPHYTIHENVAWDAIVSSPSALSTVAAAAAVCFGSLAQRSPISRASIRALVGAAPPQALRIFDINLRQHFYTPETIEVSLGLANVLKLNETELPVLAEMFGLTGAPREQLGTLAARHGLRAIALTLGAGGSLLQIGEVFSEHAGIPVKVRDTIGAGDAFTAMLTIGLLANWPAARINERANAIAAYVCSQAGATPELPAELRAAVETTAE